MAPYMPLVARSFAGIIPMRTILWLFFLAASEAGYDDVSEPEDGLISNEDDTADLVNRTRAELGHAIRNPEQTSHRNGKLPLKATVTVKAVLPAIILIDW